MQAAAALLVEVKKTEARLGVTPACMVSADGGDSERTIAWVDSNRDKLMLLHAEQVRRRKKLSLVLAHKEGV